MLNKQFYRDKDYFNFFDIEYDLFSNKLKGNHDWKNIVVDVDEIKMKQNSEKIIKDKQNKLLKSTTLIEKDKDRINNRLLKRNKDKIKWLKKLNKELLEQNYTIETPDNIDVAVGNFFNNLYSENIITKDKSIIYFRKVFKNIINNNNPPIIYTYIWEMINNFDRPYYIHLKISDIYNKILKEEMIIKSNTESYSAISLIKIQNNINKLDQNKILNIKKQISKLTKYMEPISKFIDGRMYESILSLNPLLLFQVRTIVHILSTFLGSNLIMFIERLLYKEFNIKYPVMTTPAAKDNKVIIDIRTILVDLKEYILSDLLIDGNLSYEFVKIMFPFKITEYDNSPKETTIDDLFENILKKLRVKSSLFAEIEENSFIINNIRTKVIPYYQSLYKEVTIQLLNFSDSYYRFIKNQYSGIVMFKNSI